jgi:redox-sensitive bicupin YhaK (pirin superfamily)
MNAFVFVYRGEGRFGKSRQPGKSGQALILDTTGAASFTAVAHTESNLKFLLLAGQPINEPIARFASSLPHNTDTTHDHEVADLATSSLSGVMW